MDFEKAKRIIDKTTHGEFSFYADFVNETIQKLNLDKSSKILDIGTGWGIMSILLALNGYNVSTGEPEGKAEEHFEEHHHHENSHTNWRESAKAVGVIDKIEFQHLDAEDLPFPEQSFDAIFMLDTLQHIKHKEQALKECLRVVKPQGIVSIFEMNEKGVEYCQKEYGFTPDLVIPMNHLKGENKVSVEVISGKLVNAYILRQTERKSEKVEVSKTIPVVL